MSRMEPRWRLHLIQIVHLESRCFPTMSQPHSEHRERRGDGAVHWGGKSADQPGQDPAERSPHVPGRLLAAPGALEATGRGLS